MSGLSSGLFDDDGISQLIEPLRISAINAEEEDYVEKIPGDYNMEIPGVLHQIFLHSTVDDIVRMTRVSRTFREVGTSDYLWRHILKNRSGYVDTPKIAKMVFFYDIRKKKEDLYPAMVKKFQRSYIRKKRVQRRRQKEKVEKLTKDTVSYLSFYLLWMAPIICSCICPPLGTAFSGILGIKRVYNEYVRDEVDGEDCFFWLSASYCDMLNCTCLTTCCMVYCCCCASICSFFNFFLLVGRLYLFDKDENEEGSNATVALGSPCIVCSILTLLCCVCCCASTFCIAQIRCLMGISEWIENDRFDDEDFDEWETWAKWVFCSCLFWLWYED